MLAPGRYSGLQTCNEHSYDIEWIIDKSCTCTTFTLRIFHSLNVIEIHSELQPNEFRMKLLQLRIVAEMST